MGVIFWQLQGQHLAGPNTGKMEKCILHLSLFLLVLVLCKARMVKLGGKDCEDEGQRVCNGAVTQEKGKFVKICINGKIKTKLKTKVPKDYPLVGRDTGPGKDCTWYGTVFCDGDVVEDLHRWTFLMKCSKATFTVY